ncbi:MAG: DegT/DnrJ/EryC1/StrS family aminotransferase, partial [Limnobacter sp.]
DAAQSFGAKQNESFAGTIGDIGIFSFGFYKNISSIYGGAVVSRDAELFEIINKIHSNFEEFDLIWYFKKPGVLECTMSIFRLGAFSRVMCNTCAKFASRFKFSLSSVSGLASSTRRIAVSLTTTSRSWGSGSLHVALGCSSA